MRCLLALCAVCFVAADWPQWLGPHRDGTSNEIVKPWTQAPKVLWRAPVGEGHSSPIVIGDKVFLHFKTKGKDEEQLVMFDANGKSQTLNVYERKPFSSPFGNGPRATPVAKANGAIVTFGVTGVLSAVQPKGGKIWNVDCVKEFHATVPKFGVSASPIDDGDRVIVLAGAKGASLIAFNRTTGDVVWKSQDDPTSYASPIITEHGGRRQLITLTGTAVVSLDPANGEFLWRFPFKDAINESSTTPLRVGDLIIASSVTLGSVGLKLETKGGKPAVAQAWKNPALNCYFSTPVAVGDKHVYMVTGSILAAMSSRPECALNCVEVETGKVLWTKPKIGKYHAALIRTGDNKLLMLTDSSDLVLVDPDPKEYRELCRSKICGETWAHPALANGKLYVRDNQELICLQLQAP